MWSAPAAKIRIFYLNQMMRKIICIHSIFIFLFVKSSRNIVSRSIVFFCDVTLVFYNSNLDSNTFYFWHRIVFSNNYFRLFQLNRIKFSLIHIKWIIYENSGESSALSHFTDGQISFLQLKIALKCVVKSDQSNQIKLCKSILWFHGIFWKENFNIPSYFRPFTFCHSKTKLTLNFKIISNFPYCIDWK